MQSSMALEMTHDSQPYNRIVTQVVSNSENWDVRISPHAMKFPESCRSKLSFVFRSLTLDDIMGPRYLKSDTWLRELPYTWSGDWGWQLMIIYSVFGALMMRSVLESFDWAIGIDDSRKAISSAKSRSLSDLIGYHVDWRECDATSEYHLAALLLSHRGIQRCLNQPWLPCWS